MTRDESPDLSETSARENELITLSIQSSYSESPIQIKVSLNDTVEDVKQYLNQMAPVTQPLTCFSLWLNKDGGEKLDSIRSIAQLVEDNVSKPTTVKLVLRPDPYNYAQSLSHVRKVRKAVGFVGPTNTSLTVNAGFSAFTELEPEILQTVPENSETKQKPAVDKQSPLEEYELPGGPESPESAEAPDSTEPRFLELCQKNQVIPLGKDTLNAVKPAVKALQLSQWNPPPAEYAFQGHLFYLYVVTLESKTYHIVSTTTGYYVSNSTAEKFNPSARTASGKKQESVSLFELLKTLSPLLTDRLEKNYEVFHKYNKHALAAPSNYFLASPWLVELSSKNSAAVIPDAARVQTSFVSPANTVRDWNEELQAAKEHYIEDENGQVILQEKLLKERVLNKFSFDFVDAAAKGAIDVVNGNVPALNAEEDVSARIYLHEGIFYSFGTDAAGTFAENGGNAAARYAAAKDLQATNYINNLDIDGLYTLWTAIVDYCGQRVICQTPVPGIFRDSENNGSTIIYGSVDNRERIATDERLAPLMKELGELCHLKPHKAYDVAGNGTELYSSLETKGINGTDGRNYILDLYRIAPLDIAFIEEFSNDKESPYPHSVAVLRHEAVDIWFREKVQAAWAEAKKLSTVPESEERKDDEIAKQDEALREEQEKIYAQISEQCRLNCDVSSLDESLVPESEKDNFLKDKEEVRSLSEFVSKTLVPRFVSDVMSGVLLTPLDGAFLTSILHKRGINMRYLGLLLSIAKKEGSRLNALCIVLECEAVSRSVKHLINDIICYKPCSEVASVITGFLNDLFAGTNSSRVNVEEDVKRCFRLDLSKEFWAHNNFTYLLKEISLKLGLQWKNKTYFQTSSVKGPFFTTGDLANISPIVRNTVYRSKMADDAFEAGKLCVARGDKETGIGLLEESLSLYEQVYGLIHPETSRAYINIAMLYHELNDESTASDLCRKSLIVAERTLGVDSGETFFCFLNLSLFEYSRGNALGALVILKGLLKYWYAFVGQLSNPHVLTILSNIAAMLQHLELYEGSLKWFKLSLNAAIQQYGEESVNVGSAHYQVSQAYVCVRDFHSAVNHMRLAYNNFLKARGADNENTKDCKKWLENLVGTAVNAAKMKKPGFNQIPTAPQVTAPSSLGNRVSPDLASKNINDLVNYATKPGSKPKSKSKKKSNKKR